MNDFEQLVLASHGLILVVISSLGLDVTGEWYYSLFLISGIMLIFGPDLKQRFADKKNE